MRLPMRQVLRLEHRRHRIDFRQARGGGGGQGRAVERGVIAGHPIRIGWPRSRDHPIGKARRIRARPPNMLHRLLDPEAERVQQHPPLMFRQAFLRASAQPIEVRRDAADVRKRVPHRQTAPALLRSRHFPSIFGPVIRKLICRASVGMMSTVSIPPECSNPVIPLRQNRIGTRRS